MRVFNFKWVLLLSLSALFLRGCMIETFRVDSASMTPHFPEGQWVFASKLAFGVHLPFSNYELFRWDKPQPNDMVILKVPEDSRSLFVKRVVANEGDEVQILDGKVLVNSKAIRTLDGHAENFGPITVPNDHIFLMSDNHTVGQDSRAWGPLPQVYIRGKIVWPKSN